MTTPERDFDGKSQTNVPERADDALRRLTGSDPQTLARLHASLESSAQSAELVDLAYETLDSPVGSLLLVATERGLLRVAFSREGHDRVLERLATSVSPRILRSPATLEQAARQLDDFFAGGRTGFDLPLDLRLSRGFRRLVLSHLAEIPYGHTESYAQVALAAGSPKAVRAVGSACATNPLPVVVPCHRVLRSDGSLGGYLGGLEAKRTLLTLEAGLTLEATH